MLNSFDLTIKPDGGMMANYHNLDIANHSVTIGVTGDVSAGERYQFLYHNMNTDGDLSFTFNSHVDGKKFTLSPEKSIKIQKDLNSDIVMVLDECPKLTNEKKIIQKSLDLSLDWAERSKNEFGINSKKALFGIVQGGIYKDLRLESLDGLKKLDFDGYALGGLAVGDTKNEMFNIIDDIKDYLPKKNQDI